MKLTQRRLVIGAIVVSDSAWLFSLFGALGVIFGHDGSPLSWLTVLAVMALPFLVVRFEPTDTTAIELVVLVRTLIGAAVIYLAVAANIASGVRAADLGWGVKLLQGTVPEGYAFVAVAGILMGVALWLRGGSLTNLESPEESLAFSFRLGMLALAFAASVDIANSTDLHTLPMIFVFFASGLGGLSIGNLFPETQKSAEARTWQKVIAGVVSAILLVGAVFSFIQKDLMAGLTDVALTWLGALVKGVVWIAVAPISFAINLLTDALISFFGKALERDSGAAGDAVGEGVNDSLDQQLEALAAVAELEEEAGTNFFNFIQILEWTVLGLIAIGVLVILAVAIRRMVRWQPEHTRGTRESMTEDKDVLSDVGRLLLKLVPERLTRFGRRRGFRIPDGPAGVVEALRIYYDLLIMAEGKGAGRPPHETPTEFQSTLERIFPRNLVGMATNAFNRALYGRRPASEEQIDQMRSYIKNIKAAMGTIRGQFEGFRLGQR